MVWPLAAVGKVVFPVVELAVLEGVKVLPVEALVLAAPAQQALALFPAHALSSLPPTRP